MLMSGTVVALSFSMSSRQGEAAQTPAVEGRHMLPSGFSCLYLGPRFLLSGHLFFSAGTGPQLLK